jgi:hypothetical protein
LGRKPVLFSQLSTNGSSRSRNGFDFGIEYLPCDVRDYEV